MINRNTLSDIFLYMAIALVPACIIFVVIGGSFETFQWMYWIGLGMMFLGLTTLFISSYIDTGDYVDEKWYENKDLQERFS